jgi:adenosine deaminase/aminodeoxyfutalosine deaminase
VTLSWIFDAVRHFTVPEGERVFRLAAEMRKRYPSIVGIGLGGDERLTGSEPYREIYAEARAAGLRLTNHAGETTGPEAIWEALEIGSERLGHAVSAVADERLMELLRERQVPLELNPTSNVRTGAVASFGAHPLREYFDRGLLVTLNSDDPTFFGSTVEEEYVKAHREQGFSREELKRLAANSFRASFLPEGERERWVNAIALMA